MDEFELLIAIVVGIFRLIRGIFRLQWRILVGLWRLLQRAQSGQLGAQQRAQPQRQQPTRNQPAVPASARPVTPTPGPAIKQLEKVLAQLADAAAAEADRCAGEEAGLAFVDSLRQVARAAAAAQRTLATSRGGESLGEAYAEAERLGMLYEVLSTLAGQRRDRDQLELLGDSDALAESCYRPIVDYCRQRSIALVSDRTATAIGGDKLFLLGIDDPTGLAPIVLPADWSTQIGWWPALAHEIGHDFYQSVAGLGDELRTKLRLPAAGAGRLPTGAVVRPVDIEVAVGTWHEELFADAFGTMMLGPAYVLTMQWSFASPKEPAVACAVGAVKGGLVEEHPPGHVRVSCACRLLGAMGYGAEADRLEAAWRRAHRDPQLVYFPTRSGSWAGADDLSVIERAASVGLALYETGLTALNGVPLRSISGLDFGPREHEAARGVKEAILSGRRPRLRDPRLVIAGAVLAWAERPAEAARVMAIARLLIDGVGVPRRRPATVGGGDDSAALALDADAALWRDAMIMGAILKRPTLRHRRRA